MDLRATNSESTDRAWEGEPSASASSAKTPPDRTSSFNFTDHFHLTTLSTIATLSTVFQLRSCKSHDFPAMPLLGPTMEGRGEVFQRLKPACVALSQAALSLNTSRPGIEELRNRLADVKDVLVAVTVRAGSLDPKLADYVFFPLSQVLKSSQHVSLRCLELTFQCLAILLQEGWRSHIQRELASQIVILCTMMAEKTPKGLSSAQSTAELQASSLQCLRNLFAHLDPRSEICEGLNSEANFPQLGQTISTILDAIVASSSIESQIAAAEALTALIRNVASRDTQAAFLPGIVSKLTKVLTLQSTQRRSPNVLVEALDVLSSLLVNTLGDVPTDKSVSKYEARRSRIEQEESSVINTEWLDKASTELRPAIASVMRLRDHTRDDVRDALAQLCFAILKYCRDTLATSNEKALETILQLSSKHSADAIKFRLESLIATETSLSKLTQSVLHGWLRTLPTTMQSADVDAKVQRLQQIGMAYGMIVAGGADTSIIDRMLVSVLRDSVVITLQTPSAKQSLTAKEAPVQSLDLALLGDEAKSASFGPALVRSRSQKEIMVLLEGIATQISTYSSSGVLLADLSRSLRQSRGETQIAVFWLLLSTVQHAFARQTDTDMFLTIDNSHLQRYHECLEDLYSLSVETLMNASEGVVNPQLRALALRAMALRAQVAGCEFRYELIDALYPVLHTLASANEQLRQDSITTLNIVTASCEYTSVAELIVENVDYLTNAVALKLNAFDVSPQAPQVLLMMVRLAGASLLPYLEDTIESIFAALEAYHGYPLLVELLFRVLRVVAEEGAKAPRLAITGASTKNSLEACEDFSKPLEVAELIGVVKDRAVKAKEEGANGQSHLEPHPRQPWKYLEETREWTGDASDANPPPVDTVEQDGENEDQTGEDEDMPANDPEPGPPAPKTYSLLLRISELTQHFLPSASESLRASLLALLRTTTPALAQHENSFLPLINTLWPEIVSRLDDDELHVVATALDIIGTLCEYAGDFMRSRILQLWPGLVEIYQKMAKEMVNTTRSTRLPTGAVAEQGAGAVMRTDISLKQALARIHRSSPDYLDTTIRIAWTSWVNAITTIVKHVAIPPELLDEALHMLEPVLDEQNVIEALEVRNADALWLSRARLGMVSMPTLSALTQGRHHEFAAITA